MCTLTVERGAGRLLVTMNRDELRTRAPELPPRQHGNWLGPLDGERLGTWFGVNHQGVVACLLNDYPEIDEEPDEVPVSQGPSRGELIPRLLPLGSLARARTALEELDLEPYSPFLLLLCTPQAGWMARWRGQLQLTPVPPDWSMWSSSGWRSASVGRWRAQRFRDWVEQGQPEVQGVPAFNLLAVPGQTACSPLTDRAASATRSLTQVRLADGEGVLRYWTRPHWPPQVPAAELTLPLEGGAHTAAKPSA